MCRITLHRCNFYFIPFFDKSIYVFLQVLFSKYISNRLLLISSHRRKFICQPSDWFIFLFLRRSCSHTQSFKPFILLPYHSCLDSLFLLSSQCAMLIAFIPWKNVIFHFILLVVGFLWVRRWTLYSIIINNTTPTSNSNREPEPP